MKIKHSKLGAARSNKKLIAGAAALALVGGIAPALINTTHAYTPVDDDVYYTTVGPYYFTATPDLRYWAEDDSDIYMEIEDTRVADWYGGYGSNPKILEDAKAMTGLDTVTLDLNSLNTDGGTRIVKELGKDDDFYPIDADDCDYQYACIQGKKVGETEIVVYRNGSVVDRFTLKSVKLSPKANNLLPYGRTIEGTGSLEGEEDDVLRLRNALAADDVAVSIKGERGYSITSSNTLNSPMMMMEGAALVWTIGNQQVGGGTYASFLPVDAYDKISELEENEDKLANSTASVFEELQENFEQYYDALYNDGVVYGVEAEDGSIANFYSAKSSSDLPVAASYKTNVTKGRIKPILLGGRYVAELVATNTKVSESTKDKLAEKLPNSTKDITFKGIEANVYQARYKTSLIDAVELGNALREMAVIDNGYEDDEYTLVKIADFDKLGKAVEITLDVSDADAVKSGMERTWYVAYERNGKVETVSDITYDEKNNKITFSTDTFGNYAYGYVDTKSAPAVPNTGAAPEKVAMVATATFAPLAAIAFGAFIARNRKKAANKLAKKHNHFE